MMMLGELSGVLYAIISLFRTIRDAVHGPSFSFITAAFLLPSFLLPLTLLPHQTFLQYLSSTQYTFMNRFLVLLFPKFTDD